MKIGLVSFTVLAALFTISASVSFAFASAFVRVDEVGYLPNAAKKAVLMASVAETGAAFKVVDSKNLAHYSAAIGKTLGSWNAGFAYLYQLDFSALTTVGTFRIVVSGSVNATSPWFKIGPATTLYSSLLANSREFYIAQCDGPDVDSLVVR